MNADITLQSSLLQGALVHQRLVGRNPLGIRVAGRRERINPMAKILRPWTLQQQPIMTIFQTMKGLPAQLKTIIRIIR